MKKIYAVFIFIFLAISTCLFLGCQDAKFQINLPSEIVLQNEQTPLPELKLGDKKVSYDNFYYQNDDGYIYVFGNMIYLTQDAPDQFNTQLKVIYKKDTNISKTINIKKVHIEISSLSITCNTKAIFPGENVFYTINYLPQNAILRNYQVQFDHPEYVQSQDKNCFRLAGNVEFGAELTMTINVNQNLSATYKFVVNDNVYDVYNVNQLKRISNDIYGYYNIKSDIDFSDFDWNLIDEFYGVINGNNHKIMQIEYQKRLKDRQNNNNFGFIKNLYGTVRNVVFDNFNIFVHKFHDNLENMTIGSVCGLLINGEIDNVKIIDSTIYGYHDSDDKKVKTRLYIGGVAGQCKNGIISNCEIVNSKIWGATHINIEPSSIADCWTHAGGIVGDLEYGKVISCTRSDSTTVTSQVRSGSNTSAYHCICGGIVGHSYFGKILNCNSTIFNLKTIEDIEENRKANTSNTLVGAICAEVVE